MRAHIRNAHIYEGGQPYYREYHLEDEPGVLAKAKLPTVTFVRRIEVERRRQASRDASYWREERNFYGWNYGGWRGRRSYRW